MLRTESTARRPLMPKIHDKLARFLTGAPLEATHLTADEAGRRGVRGAINLRHAFFEEGVSVSSPTLAQGVVNFIGAHSYVNDGGYLRGNVFIGRYCSIGRRVSVGAGMHRMSSISTYPALAQGTATPYTVAQAQALDSRDRRRGATVIGHDVWIGDGAVIVEGVRIGIGAVIGANVVVTRDVPDYAIVAGVPGRVVRTRFPEAICAALLASEWWNAPLDLLKTLPTGNAFEFVDRVTQPAWRETRHPEFDTLVLGQA